MGDFWSNAVRHPEDIGVGHIRRRVTYTQNGFAAGVPIGALDKGSIPIRAYAIVNTAFSAGATVTLGNIANPGAGQAAVPDSIMTNANVAPTAAGGPKPGTGVAIGQELPANTVFYAYLGGTAATAGDVTLIVEFVNARNWSDQQGGQAT